MKIVTPTYRLCRKLGSLTTFVRYLTASQASEALRPFYFAVHPDFFGQHPKERAINEESLQRLSNYLENLYGTGVASPTTVKFYLRGQGSNSKNTAQNTENHVTVYTQAVTIKLFSQDVQSTVSQILRTCHLKTDHLKSLVKKGAHRSQVYSRPIKWDHTYYAYANKQKPGDATPPARSKQTLESWLTKNRQRALRRLEKSQLIRDDAENLRSELCNRYHLRDIRWESDWNIGAFRMSLSSIRKIIEENPSYASYIRDKELIFGSITGICKEGFILLSNESVPQYWSRVLEHLPNAVSQMNLLLAMEGELSGYLGNAVISREKYFHRITIEDYAILLQKILSNFKVYHSSRRRWKEGRVILPNSMTDLKIIVEGIIGHLAVTASGQLVVPASTKPQNVINFLVQNKEKCLQKVNNYPRLQANKKRLFAQCIKNYNLRSLEVDVSLTEDQVNKGLNRLIDNKLPLSVSMQDLRIRISRYYTVLRDGEVYIPWDLHIT
ncbi:T-cell activation inhibitor, mitochondrial-like [Antedon mediterranea]|uniref:T-cell activation inhibitor, mitochondrial-like n=1 Tax=Antedon mediterranea TaxID=105859 RepID=UPI003AF9A35B